MAEDHANLFEKFKSDELEGKSVGDRAARFRKGEDVMEYGPSRYLGPLLVRIPLRRPLRRATKRK